MPASPRSHHRLNPIPSSQNRGPGSCSNLARTRGTPPPPPPHATFRLQVPHTGPPRVPQASATVHTDLRCRLLSRLRRTSGPRHSSSADSPCSGCGSPGACFGGIQHSPVDGCSAVSCNFGVLTGEDECTSFYSDIL